MVQIYGSRGRIHYVQYNSCFNPLRTVAAYMRHGKIILLFANKSL